MTPALADVLFAAFMIFCRVGACLMLVPGYASTRVPVQIRLLVAFAVSLALTPLLYDTVTAALLAVAQPYRLFLLVNEVAAGGIIGLMARLYLLGLQFAASLAANAIGLAGIPGVPVEETDALPPLAALLSLAGTMIVLAAGLQIEILRAVIGSYAALPVRLGIDPGWLLDAALKTVADSSLLALRLAAPFVVYAVVVNVAMGLANKFTPQVSMYFASLGLVTAGGLAIAYLVAPAWLALFLDSYRGWLAAAGP